MQGQISHIDDGLWNVSLGYGSHPVWSDGGTRAALSQRKGIECVHLARYTSWPSTSVRDSATDVTALTCEGGMGEAVRWYRLAADRG